MVKSPKKKQSTNTLDTLASSVNALTQSVAFVIEHMATRDDVREIINAEVPAIVRKETASMARDITEIKEDIRHIRIELRDIRLRVEALEIAVKNHSGFTKEIDHALQRIAAIEKHLGITSKVR